MKISLNRGGVDMVRLLALIAFPVMALAQPPLVPLLWTQGQSPETIRQVVREGADGGNTGFVWESRPAPDYLGPGLWAPDPCGRQLTGGFRRRIRRTHATRPGHRYSAGRHARPMGRSGRALADLLRARTRRDPDGA